MTDKEAVAYVKKVIKNSEKVIFAGQPVNEVRLYTTDKGLEMLKRVVELADREPCPDCISRQAVNEIINDIRDCISVEGYWSILERMKKLPSVQPKAKTGKWLHRNDDHNDWSECSECGYGDEGEVKFGEETPCCPYCGSRNEREGE